MNRYEVIGLGDFLCLYHGMGASPVSDLDLHIEGLFEFTAKPIDQDTLSDAYRLRIVVPAKFPHDLPNVEELDGRIPRRGAYHVNPSGSLCLGSRLRLLEAISKCPTLIGFATHCLVPYLYAVSRKLQKGGAFAFGELDHGYSGEMADYIHLFGLKTVDQAKKTVACLGMKKRLANKQPCPCSCGKRLGICQFNNRMRKFRRLAERSWFRKVASDLLSEPVAEPFSNSILCQAIS